MTPDEERLINEVETHGKALIDAIHAKAKAKKEFVSVMDMVHMMMMSPRQGVHAVDHREANIATSKMRELNKLNDEIETILVEEAIMWMVKEITK